ncbi:MAG: hypothetical protein JJ714_05145 [Acidithiobacillus sp.]|nr:hypothetical protein [Acidithiobacillus sp.]
MDTCVTTDTRDVLSILAKYDLPPVKLSRMVKPGDGHCDRLTGRIVLSESLKYEDEPEILRVAFHEAGHYYTRSFRRDVLLLYVVIGFVILLALCLAFSQVRDCIPTGVPFFGLIISAMVFETARKHWENAANRWAREHWPRALAERGHRYF